MPLSYTPLSPDFGVRIEGLDPADYASEATARLLREAIRQHKLVLINNPQISPESQRGFAQLLGDIDRRGPSMKPTETHSFISNVVPEGRLRDGELYFHSDQVYFDPPLKALSLYAIAVPQRGGETKFADATQAYRRLPESLKRRIDGLEAFHAHDYSGAKYAKDTRGKVDLSRPDAVSATHPVAWTHPKTGVPVLLINRSQTQHIVGLEAEESSRLLHELYEYIEDPVHVYTHRWTVGDLLIWDNWSLQHARNEWDPGEARTLRRVPISEPALSAVHA